MGAPTAALMDAIDAGKPLIIDGIPILLVEEARKIEPSK
jgi:photosystem I P700 chlorophyll a apoprotein A1